MSKENRKENLLPKKNKLLKKKKNRKKFPEKN